MCNERSCVFHPGGTFTLTTQPDIACGPVTFAQNGTNGAASIYASDFNNEQDQAATMVPTPCPPPPPPGLFE
jgi:hypothetical protein